MSTGKQLSFMAGEVSPEYQFNSKEISYATGLKKLYNGYVRKAGGAANRPGFSFLEYNPQINTSANKVHGSAGNTYNNVAIKEQGLGPNITAFSFYNEIDKRWDILELGFFNPAEPTRLYYRYNFTDFALPIAPLDLDFSGSSAATFAVPDLKKFRVVVVEDSVIFFPYVWYQMTVSGLRYPINLSFNLKTKTWMPYGLRSEDRAFTTGSYTVKSVGLAPFLPAGYCITIERADGYEYFLGFIATTPVDITTWNPTSGANPVPWYAHPQVSTFIKGTLDDPESALIGGEIIRLYRSSWGEDELVQFYKLAVVTSYDNDTLQFTLQDFGADDPSTTPPIKRQMIIPMIQFGIDFASSSESLGQATCGAFQQQRLFVYCESVNATGLEFYAPEASDTFLASKLNTPKQFTQPLITRISEAFSFNIAAAKNSKKVAMLPMVKCGVFTLDGVFILRGAMEGGITPTEVNPIQISAVGCHEVVDPKKVGNRGYYLSADAKRIMMILWDDTGSSCKVFEASEYSSHLLEGEDFIRMEALSNNENSLFVLTSMGRLIHITFNEKTLQGGFSVMELSDGYIENIVALKTMIPFAEDAAAFKASSVMQDTLGAYVIRNGVRSFEMLTPREEFNPLFMLYMDTAISFGTYRTFFYGEKAMTPTTYPLRIFGGAPFPDETRCTTNQATDYVANIGDGLVTSWVAGAIIPVYFNDPLTNDGDSVRLDFYYEDSNNNIRTLRGKIDFSSYSSVGGAFPAKYNVVFETDVPTSLRNVEGQSVSDSEKNYRQSRFSFAYNVIPEDILERIYIRRSPDIALGDPVPVAIYADRWLISSPLNPDYATKNYSIEYDIDTDTYSLDLGEEYLAFGFIGFPYEARIQTLPIEASDNRTMNTGTVIVNSGTMALYQSMGGFAGVPDSATENMVPLLSKYADQEDFVRLPAPFSGIDDYSLPSEYNKGVVEFKMVDPLPFSLLAVYPKGQASS